MQLNEALSAIAQQFDLNADELIAYAAEDPHDGWDEGRGSWVAGGVWRMEGQVLYALVRALKLQRVVEFGTADGCSATHIAEALKANGRGSLTCIDNNAAMGHGIPDELREWVKLKAGLVGDFIGDSTWLKIDEAQYDFVFEDADHRSEPVANVWRWAQQHVAFGGAVISHDAVHPAIGHLVKAGIEQSGAQGVRYYPLDAPPAEPPFLQSGMGFAIWRQNEQIEAPEVANAEVAEPRRATKKAGKGRKRTRPAKDTERQPAQRERQVTGSGS